MEHDGTFGPEEAHHTVLQILVDGRLLQSKKVIEVTAEAVLKVTYITFFIFKVTKVI